jgi:transcriptional regulator with XRE-family HTH domain
MRTRVYLVRMAVVEITTGQELRDLREEHGLTQTQLAKALGTTQQQVSVTESRAVVRERTAKKYRGAVYALAYTLDREKGA